MNVVDCWNPHRYSGTTAGRFWYSTTAASVTGSGYSSTNAFIGTANSANAIQAPRGLGGSRYFGQGHRIYVTSYGAARTILGAAMDPDGSLMAVCAMDTDGKISLWNDNLSTQLTSPSTSPVALNAWVKFGFSSYLHGSQGTVLVLLDGIIVRRADNLDTDPNNRGGWGRYYVGFAPYLKAAHGYACDGTGGPVDPESLIAAGFVKDGGPIGAGPSSIYAAEWPPSGAATQYEALDESDPDDDTTRIEGLTVGDKYATQHTTVSPTTRKIYAVKQTAVVRNVAGAGLSYSHRLLVNIDGTESISDWLSVTQEEWRGLRMTRPVNPITGAEWTPATINSPTYWGGFLEG